MTRNESETHPSYNEGDTLTLEHPAGSIMTGRVCRGGDGLILNPVGDGYQGEFTIATLIKNGFAVTLHQPKLRDLPQGEGKVIRATANRRDIFYRAWVSSGEWVGTSTGSHYTDAELQGILGNDWIELAPVEVKS